MEGIANHLGDHPNPVIALFRRLFRFTPENGLGLAKGYRMPFPRFF